LKIIEKNEKDYSFAVQAGIDTFISQAALLGQTLAKHKLNLFMAVRWTYTVADGVLNGGGTVIGVI
jgi:hypothetical protein